MPMSDALRGVDDIVRGYQQLADQVSAAVSRSRPAGQRSAAKPPPAQDVRRALRDVIQAWSRAEFTIEATGDHGDVSNEELFGYLAEGGRDFLKITPQMRAHIKAQLQHAFDGATTIPLRIDFEQAIQDAVRDWVQARMLGTIRDVNIRRLLAETIKRKRKAGYANPALPGVATGKLLGRVKYLRVKVNT